MEEFSSSDMSGILLKTGIGISSQWATGRRADSISGYLRLPRFFSVYACHINSTEVTIVDTVFGSLQTMGIPNFMLVLQPLDQLRKDSVQTLHTM